VFRPLIFAAQELGVLANLTIPERYQYGVSRIRDLDLPTVREIRKALDDAVAGASAEDKIRPSEAAAVAIERITPPDDSSDTRKVAEALASMAVVRASYESAQARFIDDVADALAELPNQQWRLLPEQREQFKQKLSILLDSEVFGVVAKVEDLRTESERIFCHARILTDLRPVFGQDVSKGPIAMLVKHNLKIAFHESGRKGDHDMYISLDADDLKELKKVIDRAEAKASSLRSAIGSDVKVLGLLE
jgi:hypothetical protein